MFGTNADKERNPLNKMERSKGAYNKHTTTLVLKILMSYLMSDIKKIKRYLVKTLSIGRDINI